MMRTLSETITKQNEDIARHQAGERAKIQAFLGELDDTRDQNIMSIRQVISEGRAVFLNIACDKCKTELVNPNPGVVLLSRPPRRRVACAGCGFYGSMRR